MDTKTISKKIQWKNQNVTTPNHNQSQSITKVTESGKTRCFMLPAKIQHEAQRAPIKYSS